MAQMRDRAVVMCYGPASGTLTDTEYIILCETGPSLLVGMGICAANMEIGMQVLQNTELIYEPANTIPGYIPEGIKLSMQWRQLYLVFTVALLIIAVMKLAQGTANR